MKSCFFVGSAPKTEYSEPLGDLTPMTTRNTHLGGTIENYEPLREIAPSLYCVDGDWQGSPFRRRMTVIQLKTGGLIIHNAIRLKDEDYAKLDALGKVEAIVAPNKYHASEAHFYKLKYPKAKVLVARSAAAEVKKLCEVGGVLPEGWSPKLREEVGCMEFEGTRNLCENLFFHRASRTLIVADLIFNMQMEVKGGMRFFFKLNRIYKRFGPSRIFRYVIVNEPKVATESVRELMHWDFDRVIMNHGEILNTGGKAAIQQGFAEVGLA